MKKFLIMIDIPSRLACYLGEQFLKEGIEIYNGKNEQMVKKLLDKKGIPFIFIEINNLLNPWLNFFIHTKQYEVANKKLFRLILMTDKRDVDFIQTCFLLDTIGLFPREAEEKKIFSKLYSVLKGVNHDTEKREYQRIIPKRLDDVHLTFPVKGSKDLTSGRVVNLSIGGAMIHLPKTAQSLNLEKGLLLKSQFYIKNIAITVDFEIIYVKNNVLGGKFLNPDTMFYNQITRYILDNLTEF